MDIDSKKISKLVHQALLSILDDLEIDLEAEINENSNILDILDSMDVVNLIMETEGVLESEYGNYIPLANEETFDLEMSPLLTFNSWVEHIVSMIREANE
tara:strand:- start:114 stop:413 length:300 start_codon:yes stop_codon:yes gene_type:complete